MHVNVKEQCKQINWAQAGSIGDREEDLESTDDCSSSFGASCEVVEHEFYRVEGWWLSSLHQNILCVHLALCSMNNHCLVTDPS